MGNCIMKTQIKTSELFTKTKIVFNPASKEHVADYRNFLSTGGWRNGCAYLLEYPYLDIPTMINRKIVDHFLELDASKKAQAR